MKFLLAALLVFATVLLSSVASTNDLPLPTKALTHDKALKRFKCAWDAMFDLIKEQEDSVQDLWQGTNTLPKRKLYFAFKYYDEFCHSDQYYRSMKEMQACEGRRLEDCQEIFENFLQRLKENASADVYDTINGAVQKCGVQAGSADQ